MKKMKPGKENPKIFPLQATNDRFAKISSPKLDPSTWYQYSNFF